MFHDITRIWIGIGAPVTLGGRRAAAHALSLRFARPALTAPQTASRRARRRSHDTSARTITICDTWGLCLKLCIRPTMRPGLAQPIRLRGPGGADGHVISEGGAPAPPPTTTIPRHCGRVNL